jgi:hypothetical protein
VRVTALTLENIFLLMSENRKAPKPFIDMPLHGSVRENSRYYNFFVIELFVLPAAKVGDDK